MARLSESGAHRSTSVSFIGRSAELSEARRLLEGSRLVTLTGTGGVGKTRIAAQLAHSIDRTYSDGVWFIELDGIGKSVDLATAVTSALQIQVGDATADESLTEYFATTTSLLVFDNCEHLLDDCSRLISMLLQRCSNIRILTTSREPLGLLSESVLVISPFDVAPAQVAVAVGLPGESEDAVTLFLDRARSAVPGFSATAADLVIIGEICSRLEGLPLAIELAAVRLRVLSPSQILARLDDQLGLLTRGHRDLPTRQRALRSSIEWSFELCSEEERWFWSHLSVFAPSWDLTAAQAIAVRNGFDAQHVVDMVQALVEKSIVIPYRDGDDVWFGMLNSIREFGLAQLTDPEELFAAKLHHRDRYLTMFRSAEADWIGPNQNRWLRLFSREIPNIRAALEFSLETPDEAEGALELTVVAWRICWQASLRTAEHRRWLERALAAATLESELRAYGLAILGGIAKALGETDVARQNFVAAAELIERIPGAEHSPHGAIIRGGYAESLPDSDESLALRLEGANAQWAHPELSARTLSILRLSQMYDRTGDLDSAQAIRARALTVSEAAGERYESSYLFLYSGLAAAQRFDTLAATEFTRQALVLKRDLEHPVGFAHAFEVLARTAELDGKPVLTARLLGAAATSWRESGSQLTSRLQYVLERGGAGELAKQKLGHRDFDREYEWGRALSRASAIALALGESEPPAEHINEPQQRQDPLTARERQVATLVADGLSDKQIAATLFIAQRTAEGHVQRALTKLGFTSRSQLAVWAVGSA